MLDAVSEEVLARYCQLLGAFAGALRVVMLREGFSGTFHERAGR